MRHSAVRQALAVIAGVVAASITIFLTETIAHRLFPSAPDANTAIDQNLLIAVAIGWFLGSLIGAAVAMRIASGVLPGWIVGLIIAGLSVLNTQMMPHPVWMVVAAIVLPLTAVLIAKRLTPHHRDGEVPLNRR
ncbi:hypothetical protein [Qipengyuania sediminis]|uniref:hypothetical protein n=1 Tax=Qipengyuania sediminis TaxID=1532023 RepID=UPI00105977CD|nr:hypothetical protein [Qipengyuania sediminis]